MKNSILFFLPFLVLSTLQTTAQSVVGFWEIQSVSVGNQKMTPVAKWIRINRDSTFQSGNGWTQNSIGTWVYNSKTKRFKTDNANGIKDNYQAFLVDFSKTEMIWKRTEDEMEVTVTLAKISKLPIATEDKIQGLWKLSQVKKNGKNVTSNVDSNGNQYLHIRPDKLYRLRTPSKKLVRGYWHMNGHKPELTLINFDKEVPRKQFLVSFKKNQLRLKSKKEKELIFVYDRIHQFPK